MVGAEGISTDRGSIASTPPRRHPPGHVPSTRLGDRPRLPERYHGPAASPPRSPPEDDRYAPRVPALEPAPPRAWYPHGAARPAHRPRSSGRVRLRVP